TLSGGSNRITMTAGAVFTNNATFEVSGDAGQSLQGVTGSGTFNNAGAFRKTIGNTGETRGTRAVNNSGFVEVLSGRLRLTGAGAVSNGSFMVAQAATLIFGGGAQILQPLAAVSGAGMVQFAGGSVNEGGVYNVTGGTLVTGGIAQFTGPVISVGPLGIAAGAGNFSTGAIIPLPSVGPQDTGAPGGSETVTVIR